MNRFFLVLILGTSACGGSEGADAAAGSTDASASYDAAVDGGAPDAASPHVDSAASTPDASTPDASTPVESAPDASAPETSSPDASRPDASTPDASTREATAPDAGIPEATAPDVSAAREAGTCVGSANAAACVACCDALYPGAFQEAFFGNECLYCTATCVNTRICTDHFSIDGPCLRCAQPYLGSNCPSVSGPTCVGFVECLKKCPTN
jgi:hypothetical protein